MRYGWSREIKFMETQYYQIEVWFLPVTYFFPHLFSVSLSLSLPPHRFLSLLIKMNVKTTLAQVPNTITNSFKSIRQAVIDYFNRPCVFCNISTLAGSELLHEDEAVIAFLDKSPVSDFHFLVVPKEHSHVTVKDLTRFDVALVKHMADVGYKVMADHGYLPADILMGFHVPPFVSVKHLHMHCVALPTKRLRGFTFNPNNRWLFKPYKKVLEEFRSSI